jgi:transposase
MITLELSDQDWKNLAEELDDPTVDPRIHRKLMAIRMHGLGVPHGKIAATLNISDDTVTNYVKLYRDEGLGGLVENRHYRPTSSVEPYIEEIGRSFAETPVATASEGAERIESISGIRCCKPRFHRVAFPICGCAEFGLIVKSQIDTVRD